MWLLIGFIVAAIIAVGLAIAETFWPVTLVVLLLAVTAGLLGWESFDVALSYLQWYYIGPYLLAGLGWVFFKWTRLVEESLARQRNYNPENIHIPTWTDNWHKFGSHFFWWPLSMIAYVLSDLLFEVWEHIAKLVCKTFDRYAEWRFATIRRK